MSAEFIRKEGSWMKIVSYSTERINHAQGNSCNTPKKLYHVAINTMTVAGKF